MSHFPLPPSLRRKKTGQATLRSKRLSPQLRHHQRSPCAFLVAYPSGSSNLGRSLSRRSWFKPGDTLYLATVEDGVLRPCCKGRVDRVGVDPGSKRPGYIAVRGCWVILDLSIRGEHRPLSLAEARSLRFDSEGDNGLAFSADNATRVAPSALNVPRKLERESRKLLDAILSES